MLLVTADWHLDENQLANYRWNIFNTIFSTIEKYNIDTFIFLGDLTERKDRHSSEMVNRIIEFFSILSTKVKIIFVCGNHDRVNESSSPFFKFTKYLPCLFIDNFTVVDRTLFISYKNSNEFKNILHSLDDKIDYIFMHQQIDDIARLPTTTNINSFDFQPFKKIFSGHIHQYIEQDNIVYVGAPHQVDFGEMSGFILLLDNNYNIIDKIKHETINRYSIELDELSDLNSIDLKQNDQLKIKYKIHKNDLFKTSVISDEISRFITEKSSILVSIDFVIIDTQEIEQFDVLTDDIEIIHNFCKQENISDKLFIDTAINIVNMRK